MTLIHTVYLPRWLMSALLLLTGRRKRRSRPVATIINLRD